MNRYDYAHVDLWAAILGAVCFPRAMQVRRRQQTHVLCKQADKPGLRAGRCYEILDRTRAGIVLINDDGQRRVYGMGKDRFYYVSREQARAINSQYDDALARVHFYLMSGEWP